MNRILDIMADTPAIIDWANSQDVLAFSQFLKTTPERPLICIGSGGSFSTCELIAMMYETLGGIAKAVTPYSVYSMSDKTLSQCKILLVSNSGHNKDIVRIAKHCMELAPSWVANLTTADGKGNDLKAIIPANNSFNFTSDIKDGFISVNSVIANYALIIKAFKGIDNIVMKPEDITIDTSDVKHFIILYGGWGKPVAIDLESKLVESGVATCAVSDYRNFCHGRFIFAGNHCGHEKKTIVPNDCAVIMLTTPREYNFAQKIKEILPDRCRVINIRSSRSDSLAAIELLYKASVFAGDIAEGHCVNPLSPSNHGGIDKRKPLQMPFISDIKNSGPLTI